MFLVGVPGGNQGSILTLGERGVFFSMEMCERWLGFFDMGWIGPFHMSQCLVQGYFLPCQKICLSTVTPLPPFLTATTALNPVQRSSVPSTALGKAAQTPATYM